jgi:hypothetical protein
VRAVLVIGAGAAGTGAALASARAGMRVTVADGGTGASTLATGALDVRFWQHAAAEPWSLEPAAREALDRLEGYVLPQEGAVLLSVSGIARPARGYDAALLDVRTLAGQRVGVVRCDRPGWDARSLALAWGERYEPIDVAMLRHIDERVLPDADFATRHDDSGRLQWLADRLREALAPAGRDMAALVLPPCLGVERARARELSELVGIPCGEPISLPGGPSGLRFERARDRALSAAFVERRHWRARRVHRGEGVWHVAMEDGAVAESDAVVLAAGGLIGGGIEYAPAESVIASAMPPSARPAFRLTIDAPLTLAAFGRELEMPSTLFGSEPEAIAWPFSKDALMEHVGVLADRDGRTGSSSRTGPTGEELFVCGDLRADGPRTWLGAFATGVAAGLAAAERLLSERSRFQSPDVGPPIRP